MAGENRFGAVDPQHTTATSREILETIHTAFGRIPNSFKVLANSEAFLSGYWSLDQALEHGKLPGVTRNEIAIAVSQINGCPYCLSAFTALGQAAGISEHELAECRLADSDDPKVDAALKFAKAIVQARGAVSDQDLANVRGAGYADAEIMEIVGNVGLITCANYINLVAQTDIDFPLVRPETLPSQLSALREA